jgi:sugar phosphate isomerase/epimerase
VSLPSLTPAEACAALAAAGFSGVEWRVGEAPHAAGSSAAAFLVGNRCTLAETVDAAREGARLAREHGLTVVGLAPYVDSGDLLALDRALDMAVAAGTGQVRLQAPRMADAGTGHGRGYGALVQGFAAFLADAVPRAATAGVRLALELHHRTVVPSVGLAMPLLRPHPPTDLGVIYDAGNLVHEGYEDPRIALELLGPYLHHVHLKNVDAARDDDGRWGYRWAHLDDGLVDVPHLLELLDRNGYDGWVSIEDLSFPGDSRVGIGHNAAVLGRIDAPGWRPATQAATDTSRRSA